MMLSRLRVAAVVAKPWLFSIVLAFALFVPDRAVADDRFGLHRPINRIVVFGTSLSDPGNAYALFGGLHLEAPYATLNPLTLTPESETPYKVGGNRFSNGLTWVELLAKAIGFSANAKPAYAIPRAARASNYAVGGTRARTKLGEMSLGQQVTDFVNTGTGDSRALYIIEVGGNDVGDALGGDANAIPLALGAVYAAIDKLHTQAGATKFLVWNVPNLGRAPATRAVDEFMHLTQGTPLGAVIAGATFASQSYNNGLTGILDVLSAVYPEIEIIRFNAYEALETIVENRSRYGLANATDACIRPLTDPPSRCPNQDRYLFWDGIHPSRAGHAIIAFLVGKTLVTHALQDD